MKTILTDVQGRIIFNKEKPEMLSANEFKFNLESLARGTYFLMIKDNLKQSVRKIVKE